MIDKDSRIYVAGSTGMVGSAVVRKLAETGYHNVLVSHSHDLDLTNRSAVDRFLAAERPDLVIDAAARVGGILDNSRYRAEFIYDNLMIEANLIDASYEHDVRKLLFLGSSCIYPRLAPQPMREEYLLTGPLETTNEPYAIAKIAGIKLCESYYRQYGCNFYSVMPTNLYGPNDNFDLESSHVIPALIRKFHDARVNGEHEVVVWGTGEPLREFLYVDDLATAVIFLMENADADDVYGKGISHINIGSGEELTIRHLAEMVRRVVGFEGDVLFDSEKPDGTPRKFLDSERLRSMGWRPMVSLEDGLRLTYDWFLQAQISGSVRTTETIS
jgi:GDP-L-fucose synthase